ncbi:DnaQ-like DNA polymerase III subunit [Gordonia phage VanLee]|uniref:DnaQ-like DNA polymerase III subunit n=1 Tax=Gordonia phage VanLee TaxID=2845816 RepID=A0A8F2IF84_9CAUD|nr:DnaQ-like DNA polymerase III subunit [Gordonia phage VanLee]QWS68204.1 DnaQ-like DNA polymerase III subunit [Gordonia phage VanLee]
MRYWYDTEFLEDGSTIELISIGIVAEDGREFYAVNADMRVVRIKRDPWLLKNVWPHLPTHSPGDGWIPETLDRGHPDVKPKAQIATEVRDFLCARTAAELWAWYGAYDHVVLAQLFGRMIDLPHGIPMWTNDLRQEVRRLGDPELPEQPAGLHNALADARHLKARYDHLFGQR